MASYIERRKFLATLGRRGCVAVGGAHAAARDEFSLGRNDRANRTGIPARLERVINTPERNS